jgi:phosphoglycolate phosphatase
LADTLDDIGDAMNAALEAKGLPTHPPERYRRLVGGGATNLVLRAALGVKAEEVGPLVADFLQRYSRRWVHKSAPYPGIPELLRALQERKLSLAVLSNKQHAGTRTVVEALFPDRPFQHVHGMREGVPRKPDPSAALELAALLSLSPAECAFVGDSEIDIQTAAQAGMTSITVLWGFRDQAELESHGPTTFVQTTEQLLEILDAHR